MEKRIELERRARKANQITELNLDNCRSTSIVGLTDEYTALETLSLINVGLTTLKGFPNLPNLKKLELSDNRISNGLNYLHTSPKLQYLNLSGNKIKDLEALKPLEHFKHLAVLDLFNNEATQTENYREKMFELLPSLKFLDGYDCNDVESPEEEEQYSSEDNANNAFCINGLEFNLDELEAFKQHLQAKRQAANIIAGGSGGGGSGGEQIIPSPFNNNSLDTVDDLDEYLKELKLKEEREKSRTTTDQTNRTTERCNSSPFNNNRTNTTITTTATTPMNFALLLYWFLAVLNMAKIVFQCEDEEDEEDSEPSGDEDENVDVSLSEVYNEDLEEDEDEWEEANNDEEDEDDESDEDELNESSVTTGEQQTTEKKDSDVDETHARGKKRKHEG